MPSINVKLISLVLVLAIVGVTSGLKCFQCGQYHDGVGSITPCFNSTPTLPVFLKDCSRSSQKFCIKYVSELSTVRDCVESCEEKEVWGSQTLCCDQDGCNSATHLRITSVSVLLGGLLACLPSLLSSFVH